MRLVDAAEAILLWLRPAPDPAAARPPRDVAVDPQLHAVIPTAVRFVTLGPPTLSGCDCAPPAGTETVLRLCRHTSGAVPEKLLHDLEFVEHRPLFLDNTLSHVILRDAPDEDAAVRGCPIDTVAAMSSEC
jgi:hypothetical protein